MIKRIVISLLIWGFTCTKSFAYDKFIVLNHKTYNMSFIKTAKCSDDMLCPRMGACETWYRIYLVKDSGKSYAKVDFKTDKKSRDRDFQFLLKQLNGDF